MASANVELVRAVYEHWARGDFTGSQRLLDDDFEWVQTRTAVEPGAHRGSAERAHALEGIFEVWEGFRVAAEELIDGGEQVVAVARSRGVGRQSGLELDQTFAYVWTIAGEKLVRMEIFPERADALRAAGLAQ